MNVKVGGNYNMTVEGNRTITTEGTTTDNTTGTVIHRGSRIDLNPSKNVFKNTCKSGLFVTPNKKNL